MGYLRHHTIVVTGWDKKSVVAAYREAVKAFTETRACVSKITPGGMNGQRSFFIAPDGSKEGWHDSALGDAAREAFTKWLRSFEGYVDFVEVEFGGDGDEAVITDDIRNRDEPVGSLPATQGGR